MIHHDHATVSDSLSENILSEKCCVWMCLMLIFKAPEHLKLCHDTSPVKCLVILHEVFIKYSRTIHEVTS